MLELGAGHAAEAETIARHVLRLKQRLLAADPNNQDARVLLAKAKVVLRSIKTKSTNRSHCPPKCWRDGKGDQRRSKEPIHTQSSGRTQRARQRLFNAGRVAEAIEHHTRATAICEKTLAANPDSEDTRSDVAFTRQHLGQAQLANGETEAALENFRGALQLRELSAADSSNARARQDVAMLQLDSHRRNRAGVIGTSAHDPV